MDENNESIDKALLIIIDPRDTVEADANAVELRLLCESAAVVVVDEMRVRRDNPDHRHYIGKGQAEEAFQRVQDSGADVVIMGADLTPSQQRNLERITTVRGVDRTQLILDIFAQRARTSEGKLQVELAQYKYLLPRLSGKGIEMSRVGGTSSGGVATRGPGETKLETDRRRVKKHISVLTDELEDVVKHRTVQNKARRRLMIPNAALVGYTSAGKSTLLNLLANSDIEAHSRLFATLDPTTRRVELADGHAIMISDTVGFLSNLPHHLIAAFRATMEEVVEADFLIHVVDVHHPYYRRQMESVMEVLIELGVGDKPTITVFNKSDLLKDQYELRRLIADTPYSCYMSALVGEGKQYLDQLITKVASELMQRIDAILPYEKGDLLAMCHERGRIISLAYEPDGVHVTVELSPDLAPRILPYQNA